MHVLAENFAYQPFQLLPKFCLDISELMTTDMHSSSGIAKGGPGRAQACLNVCCALPLKIYIL